MKKISTVQTFLVVLLCLDEAGEIILEQKVATTPEAMKQTFARIRMPDPGRSAAVPQESRGRLFSRVSPWA